MQRQMKKELTTGIIKALTYMLRVEVGFPNFSTHRMQAVLICVAPNFRSLPAKFSQCQQ